MVRVQGPQFARARAGGVLCVCFFLRGGLTGVLRRGAAAGEERAAPSAARGFGVCITALKVSPFFQAARMTTRSGLLRHRELTHAERAARKRPADDARAGGQAAAAKKAADEKAAAESDPSPLLALPEPVLYDLFLRGWDHGPSRNHRSPSSRAPRTSLTLRAHADISTTPSRTVQAATPACACRSFLSCRSSHVI